METKDSLNSPEVDFSGIEFIISDWDGTLADSMPAYTASYAKILFNDFGIDEDASKKFYVDKTGAPLSSQFREGVRQFAGKDIINTLPYEERFWENLKTIKPDLLPGAKEFIAKLRLLGFHVVVWSGTRTDVLQKGIDQLSFSKLVDFAIGNKPGSTTLVKGKGLLRNIAEHFHLDSKTLAEKALVIGDGSGDIKAGKAIKARIAGFGDPKDPNLVGADFVFNDYNALVDILSIQNQKSH